MVCPFRDDRLFRHEYLSMLGSGSPAALERLNCGSGTLHPASSHVIKPPRGLVDQQQVKTLVLLGGLDANALFGITPRGYWLLTLIKWHAAFGENIAMPSGNWRIGNRVTVQAFPERFHQLDFFRDRHLGKVGVSHENFLQRGRLQLEENEETVVRPEWR
ncbi:MAG: hypothetical protein WBJ68_11560 [Candidatus Dechloromonas phosphoritropha]